jgi:hypothetical protein
VENPPDEAISTRGSHFETFTQLRDKFLTLSPCHDVACIVQLFIELDCGQFGLRALVVAELDASVVEGAPVSRWEPSCKSVGVVVFSRALILMVVSAGQ